MRKILIFAPTAPSSGITQFILNFINNMDPKEFSFDFVSFKNHRLKEWAEQNGTRYFELNVSLYKHPIKYKKLLMDIFNNGYSAVHFHLSAITDLRQFKYARNSKSNYIIIHSHNTRMDHKSKLRRIVFGLVHKALRQKAAKYANKLCACSKEAAEWLFGKKQAQKAIILKNGIDVNQFAFNPQIRQQIRQELNVEDSLLLGNVGRFSYQKNHSFLIDVFYEVIKQKPNAKLLLLGEGELKEQIVEKVKQLGLEKKVIFAGFTSQVAKYYQAMDIFLLPSVFEGFPISLIEVQASGTLSFVSDAVTKDIKITNMVKFLPLQKGARYWADEIVKSANTAKQNTAEDIIKSGYSNLQLVEDLKKLFSVS